MANNVTVMLHGAAPKVINDATNVKALLASMGLSNYTASVAGVPVSGDYEFEDYDFVQLALATKGGRLVAKVAIKNCRPKTILRKAIR